jgi:hypothetical protein
MTASGTSPRYDISLENVPSGASAESLGWLPREARGRRP